LKKELQQHAKEGVIALDRCTREIDCVVGAPKTISGKLRRNELRLHKGEGDNGKNEV
jgi:acyl-coenzyme A synthetase/AMP-(fatty) acid ligase